MTLNDYYLECQKLKKNPKLFNEFFHAYTVKFCEENDYHGLFVTCKLNPLAFYAFAKYRVEDKNIKWLLKAINKINTQKDNYEA